MDFFDFEISKTRDLQGFHILTYIIMHYPHENLSYLTTRRSLDMLPLHTLISIWSYDKFNFTNSIWFPEIENATTFKTGST